MTRMQDRPQQPGGHSTGRDEHFRAGRVSALGTRGRSSCLSEPKAVASAVRPSELAWGPGGCRALAFHLPWPLLITRLGQKDGLTPWADGKVKVSSFCFSDLEAEKFCLGFMNGCIENGW